MKNQIIDLQFYYIQVQESKKSSLRVQSNAFLTEFLVEQQNNSINEQQDVVEINWNTTNIKTINEQQKCTSYSQQHIII